MDLRNFVDEELYPAMWSNLSTLFPEMGFSMRLGKWMSPKNLDGTEPRSPRRDKTVVTQRFFHVALENGAGDVSGRAKDLITLYLEHNGIHDRIEAIKQIASRLSLNVPEGADASKWEEARERREQLALSYSRQKEALFSPEGEKVLRYLKEERGYSEELIKEMGLGYISPAEARTLEDRCKVGIAWRAEEYPLSIAYFSRGNVMGFKFRCIADLEGKPKYMNTRSLGTEGMDSNPFGLTPQSLNQADKEKVVVVVEGELDALHAIAMGLPNVIAVAGGKITEGKARTLKKNGYKNIVILLDADEAGQRFTAESIYTIDKMGLNSAVATLPEGKDADEYLRSHTLDELKDIIKGAQFGGAFLYIKMRDKFLITEKGELDGINFIDAFCRLASSYADPVKREMLLRYLLNDFKDTDIERIQKGIREKVELQAEETERKKKKESADRSLSKAKELLANGKTKEAAETTQKALESLSDANKGNEYSYLLEDNTEQLWQQYKKMQEGLPTKITLTSREGDKYRLSFPPGAISVIGAQTGHGKSKMLISIALNALGFLDDGDTLLYITYEESELLVNMQFLNAYANLFVNPQTNKGKNANVILSYLRSGDKELLSKDTRNEFLKREEEWKRIRGTNIKIVKPEDNYLENLLNLINFANKYLSVKAVFIDYAQEIYVREWSNYSRTDELKEAMVELDAIAQRTNIPIIMAAQLNKDASSPLALSNRSIADSSWIGRKASEILLIWSNTEKSDDTKVDRMEKEIEKPLGEKLELGKGGKLYVKLTKSRMIPPGSHAIIPIKGSTGRVGETTKKEEPRQKEFLDGGSPLTNYKNRSTVADDNAVIDPEKQRPYRGEEDGELPF